MISKCVSILAYILVLVIGFSVRAHAEISLQSVVTNLSEPVFYYDPDDGSGRTFIVQKSGQIKIFDSGQVLATPFVDLSSRISTDGERGLLSMAFDPHFRTNRRFFVYYTNPVGTIVISSFVVSASNKNVADPRSERARIRISHSENNNHNGGQLAFGPDNFLYIGVGDGGAGGDPHGNAQNKSVLLGKMLRIDVSRPSGHTIPKTNPFRGISGTRPEIFAYGLRNPWRFSFDKVSKRLFVGDVGQDQVEEIDIVKSRNNLGWNTIEGVQCFKPSSNCNTSGLTKPIATYTHSEGLSVTGGYVYHGAIASLKGRYIFGDFESGTISTLTQSGHSRTWTREAILRTDKSISSFGQDRAGEVYVVDFAGGIFKIVEN